MKSVSKKKKIKEISLQQPSKKNQANEDMTRAGLHLNNGVKSGGREAYEPHVIENFAAGLTPRLLKVFKKQNHTKTKHLNQVAGKTSLK